MSMIRPPPTSTLFPYTTLFRSSQGQELATREEPTRREVYGEFQRIQEAERQAASSVSLLALVHRAQNQLRQKEVQVLRSEEHTSELQSHVNLVCRLLLEKKKKN